MRIFNSNQRQLGRSDGILPSRTTAAWQRFPIFSEQARFKAAAIMRFSNPDRWKSQLAACLAFKEEHKRLPSTVSKNDDERYLACWRREQLLLKRKGNFPPERLEKFEEAGLAETSWEIKLNECFKFIKEHKRLPSTISKDEAERRIAHWRNNQNRFKKQGQFSPEKLKKFKKAGLMRMNKSWETSLGEFLKFKEEHNRFPSAMSKDEAERRIAHWRNDQFKLKRKGILSPDRLEKLVQTGLSEPLKIGRPRLQP